MSWWLWLIIAVAVVLLAVLVGGMRDILRYFRLRRM